MRIWTNTLIKDEDRFVWFAVMSVIEHVDRMLIWDTGSTDLTLDIVKEVKKLYPKKVEFREVGEVTPEAFPLMREKMLEATFSDWVILVDGDEVWWDEAIREVISLINAKGDYIETVVNRCYNLVGDIFHYQDEEAGMYEIGKSRGHLNIRAMSMKIPGLHAANPHGQQAYFDKDGIPIQERRTDRRIHLEEPGYLHFTHLRRSSSFEQKVPKRKFKLKYEIGKSFPVDFYYPEVFFNPRPMIVPSPWEKMNRSFFARALFETPFKKIRRKFFRSRKSGY